VQRGRELEIVPKIGQNVGGRAYLSENEVEVEVVHRGREFVIVTKRG